MRILCRYSGLAFQTSYFDSLQLPEVGVHPFLEVPIKNILGRAGEWARGELSPNERKLLFVALLKASKLVDFKCAANPSRKVIQRYMELLLRTIIWKSELDEIIPLPRYSITYETRDLENISHWLSALADAKKDWESRGAVWSFSEKLRIREAALARLIKSPGKRSGEATILAKRLANWALEASGAPSGIQEYWKELFLLKDNMEIYNASQVDLEEMIEWFEDNLEQGSIYAHATMKHVRLIWMKNKRGLEYGIGMMDSVGSGDGEVDNYAIIESGQETEEHNFMLAASLAPSEEPLAENYQSKVEFLRAKARWNIAQRIANDLVTKTKEMQKAEEQAPELNLPEVEELFDLELDRVMKFIPTIEDKENPL